MLPERRLYGNVKTGGAKFFVKEIFEFVLPYPAGAIYCSAAVEVEGRAGAAPSRLADGAEVDTADRIGKFIGKMDVAEVAEGPGVPAQSGCI